jgi:hypothetical protein
MAARSPSSPTLGTNARGHDVRLEVHGTRDSLAAGLGPGLPLRSAESPCMVLDAIETG